MGYTHLADADRRVELLVRPLLLGDTWQQLESLGRNGWMGWACCDGDDDDNDDDDDDDDRYENEED